MSGRKIRITAVLLAVSMVLTACGGMTEEEAAQMEALTSDVAQLEEANAALETEIAELEKEKKNLEDAKADLEEQKSALEEQLASTAEGKTSGGGYNFPEGGFQPGVVEGNTYYNESVGVKLEIPDNLTVADSEMISLFQELSDEMSSDGFVYYDLMVINDGGSFLRAVAMQNYDQMGAQDFVKAYFKDNSSWQMVFGEDIDIAAPQIETVTIAGEEYVHGSISMGNLGSEYTDETLDMELHIFAKEAGSYMYYFSINDVGGTVGEFLDLIASVEAY